MVALVLGVALAALAGRLFQLQVLDHERYSRLARSQHRATQTIPAQRAGIFSSDGVELAVSVPIKSICVDPATVAARAKIIRSVALTLSRATGLPYRIFFKELSSDDPLGWTIPVKSETAARAIEALRIPGVAIIRKDGSSGPARLLSVNTKEVKNPSEHVRSAAAKLSELTGLPREKLLAILERKADCVWIKRHVTDGEAEAVQALGMRGVVVCEEILGPQTSKSIRAFPRKIGDPESTAERLSEALGERVEKVRELLDRRARFAWIKRRVEDNEAAAVLALDVPGVFTRDEYHRFYPQGELLGQVLGYVNTDQVGQAGVEQALESKLAGKPGKRRMARTSGSGLICLPGLKDVEPQPGEDIVLTIDSSIQRIAEQEIAAAVGKWRPDRAVVVVIDPSDHTLLAVANWPPFNPNAYSSYSNAERKRREHNSAAVGLYEPGSVFKPFVAALVIEKHLANENTVFNCDYGCGVINGRRLHDVHPYGLLTLRKIIVKSSNIGAAKTALLLGPNRLRSGLVRFGFGGKDDLPIPGTPRGWLHPVSTWTSYSISSIAIGQEISTTAVQLCNAFAIIASDGRRVPPRLLKQAAGDEESAFEQAIRPQTARRIRSILAEVVTEGTGKRARLDAYVVGGKTGTAQIALPGGRGYAPNHYNSSFVGMAPIENPRICVLVTLRRPRKAHYGGTVAAPAAGRIIRRSLAYLRVPPQYRHDDLTAQARHGWHVQAELGRGRSTAN